MGESQFEIIWRKVTGEDCTRDLRFGNLGSAQYSKNRILGEIFMQAYKLKGKIDEAGNLVITEPVNMPAGDVEVIVLQLAETVANNTVPQTELQPETPKRKSKVKAFEGLFENAPPVPPDFDPDQAKWEYLKEKHNL